MPRRPLESIRDAIDTSSESILSLVKSMDLPDDIEPMRVHFVHAIDHVRQGWQALADARYYRCWDTAEVFLLAVYRPKSWLSFLTEKKCDRRTVETQVFELCVQGADGGITSTRFNVWANLVGYFAREWILRGRLNSREAVEHVKNVTIDHIVKEYKDLYESTRINGKSGEVYTTRKPGPAGGSSQPETSSTAPVEQQPVEQTAAQQQPVEQTALDPLADLRQQVVAACAKWVQTATEDHLRELMSLFARETVEIEPVAVEGEANGTVDA